MYFKKASCFLLATAMLLSVAGCQSGGSTPAPSQAAPSSSAPASSEAASEAAPAEKVKIIWGGGSATTGGREAIVEEFNKSQDKIEVVLVDLPADASVQHDTYVTSFAAGSNDYDVIASNVPWPAEFSQAGYALAIDRFAERDGVDFDDYLPGYIDAYTFQGQMWGMPTYGNVAILYYRKDIVSTPPKTWDELIDMAKANTGKEGTKYGYLLQAAQYEGLTCNATDMIMAYGGAITDGDGKIVVNSQGTIDALTEMQRFVKEGILPQDVTTHKEANSADIFLAGEAVFMRNWPGQWVNINDPSKSKVVDKVGFCPLPAGSERSAAILGGWGTMIYSGTKHPEEAWEFTKFVAGKEGQKIFAQKDKQMPTMISLYDDSDVKAASPVFDGLLDAAMTAVTRPVSPIYNQISEIVQIEVSGVFVGTTTPEDAAKNMQTKMEQAVASNT